VCAFHLLGIVAQSSQWQQVVLIYGAGVIYHQDIELGIYLAVLEPVVENYQVHIGMLPANAVDTHGALFAHCDHRVGKFCLYLLGFIADIAIRRTRSYFEISFCFASVAPRQQCNGVCFAKMTYQEFAHRSFAGSADSNIAYTNNRDVVTCAFLNARIVQSVPQRDDQTVYP
jgi:hypothetical protein